MQRDFLWSGVGEGKRDHLVNWDVVCKPKSRGGLGFGKISIRNVALLGKWMWRYPREGSALWHQVILSIYGSHSNGWDVNNIVRWSHRCPWKAIALVYQEFSKFTRFVVGNGDRIRFWDDLWWGEQPLGVQYPRLLRVVTDKNAPISSILGYTRPFSWNFTFRRNLSDSEIEDLEGLMQSFDRLHISSSVPDKRSWSLSPSGLFTVKSFFLALSQYSKSPPIFPTKFVWNAQVPFKVKSFVWLVAHKKVNTNDLLQLRRPYKALSPDKLWKREGDEEGCWEVHFRRPFQDWEVEELTRVQNLGRYRYDSAESNLPRPWPLKVMKRKQLMITDMHFDVLKLIIMLVAKSSHGAADLARLLSVSRLFMTLSDEKEILQAAVFDNVNLSSGLQYFQNIKGLLYRCADAGNAAAQYMLGKILLLTSSKLLIGKREHAFLGSSPMCGCPVCQTHTEQYAPAYSFMAHFMPNEVPSKDSNSSLPHFIFVRFFLERCGRDDLLEMRLYLYHYFEYFLGSEVPGSLVRIRNSIKKMCIYGDAAQCYERMANKCMEMKGKTDTMVVVHDRAAQRSHQYGAKRREVVDMLSGREAYDGEPLNLDKIFDAFTEEFQKMSDVSEDLLKDMNYRTVQNAAIMFDRLEKSYIKGGSEALKELATNRCNAISMFDGFFLQDHTWLQD
ncbi:hypothetical protein VitviT2T_016805 [Vitis vinifera]|uniref:Reverse transcriptase zinc-binding domain-containing protein n=3 Tax=Vitis vinifera TaxID=29760 RepID=A0ABY9CSS5_VITVI|nr:hypothetical protein VitviT2T_016805 [Vitis vinifera]